MITVITPTTGKKSLDLLCNSISQQNSDIKINHILLWDDCRDKNSKSPETYNKQNRQSYVLPDGYGRNRYAPGSALRAIGLMIANTEWVTFADDDVWWEKNHIEELMSVLNNDINWARTYRNIWSPDGERIGIDNFESVGDDNSRKVPYEMCDNNCMIFRREFGVKAAHLYRETKEYNDDRLMYQFLKQYAGPCGKTNSPTINQTCPNRLTEFFINNCYQN